MNGNIKTDFLTSTSSFTIGMGSVLNVGGNYFPYHTSANAAEADWMAMARDWAAVGQDIRVELDRLKREQSIYSGFSMPPGMYIDFPSPKKPLWLLFMVIPFLSFPFTSLHFATSFSSFSILLFLSTLTVQWIICFMRRTSNYLLLEVRLTKNVRELFVH